MYADFGAEKIWHSNYEAENGLVKTGRVRARKIPRNEQLPGTYILGEQNQFNSAKGKNIRKRVLSQVARPLLHPPLLQEYWISATLKNGQFSGKGQCGEVFLPACKEDTFLGGWRAK